jgi:hypothetical protein
MAHIRNSIVVLLVAALLSAGFVAPNDRAAAELAIPDTRAGSQLSWALEQVNSAADGATEADIAEHFSDAYLAIVTPAQLIGYFRDYIYPAGPMTVVRFEGGATELRTNAILQGPYGYWRVELGVTPNAPHKIDTMWFEPVWTTTTPDTAPRGWSDLKRDLAALAPYVSVTVGELDGGECFPVARVEPDLVLPIASSFKLYVLGELARQISEQQAGWLELLPISTRYISQPNGEMRILPVGSEYTLAHFAEQMISKSDNTATDHLIGRLGREEVEAAFAEMGQADPTVNVPLMLTRQWFALRMRFTDEQIEEFLSLDDAGRLAFLQDVADPVADTILETELWPGSRWASEVEWFASSSDLCRALAYLQERGEQPGMSPVLDALSLEPEIVFDPQVWSYVGYKGGYETGVMSENFLLQRASDGRWFSISAVIYDPNWEINGPGLRDLIVQATQMLAFEE